MAEQPSSEQFERVPWRDFELEVSEYIRAGIDRLQFGLIPDASEVVSRCRLYSKARESDITFDVVVKTYAKPKPTTPWHLWIWECKNYSHDVPVDDVEEFHSKLVQVGAHKGTVVTRQGFQAGAIAFARSHGIGLMTLYKGHVQTFAMSDDPGGGWVECQAMFWMFGNGQAFDAIEDGCYLSAFIRHELRAVVGSRQR